MIYILIVMWFGIGRDVSGKAALAVEFNSMEACQAAAAKIRKQQPEYTNIGALICAEKGAKK